MTSSEELIYEYKEIKLMLIIMNNISDCIKDKKYFN